MDQSREQLLNTYAASIVGLQNTVSSAFVTFISQSLQQMGDPMEMLVDSETGQNKTRLYLYMRDAYPLFIQQFAGAAMSLGESQYTLRKQQAQAITGKEFGDNTSMNEALAVKIFQQIPPYWEMTGMVQKSLRNNLSLQDAAKPLVQAMANISRETANRLAREDSASKTSVVYAQASACLFCKRIAAGFQRAARRGTSSSITSVDFHDGCNCVVDVTWVGERSFVQPFVNEIEDLEAEAEKQIKAGEAGQRTLQVGSEEWFSSTERSVYSEMEQSNHFKRLKKPERERFSQALNDAVKGKLTTEEEDWMIDRTGYDSFELLQPVSKPIEAPTEKNVLSVMRHLDNV